MRRRCSIISNVTGQRADFRASKPGHWVKHVRQAVRFGDGIQTLVSDGVRPSGNGPGGVLCGMGLRCLPRMDASFIPSLRKGKNELNTVSTALGKVHGRPRGALECTPGM